MSNCLLYQLNPLILASVPNAAYGSWKYELYLGVHILSLFTAIVFLMLTMRARTSKAQTAVATFETGAIIYTVGFVQEIISDTAEGGFIACLTQYLGEAIVFVAVVFFVSELCSVKVPAWIYAIQVTFSVLALSCLASTRITGLFYNSIGINTDGPFSRPEIDHGIGFFIFAVYMFIVSAWVLVVSIKDYRTASPVQRKRLSFLLGALFFCWLPYGLTLLGITKGYEIPAVGVAFAGICLYFCFIKYGFFDSLVLAGSYALEHGKEGIIVVDTAYRIRYQNRVINSIFGKISEEVNLYDHPVIGEVFKGSLKTYNYEGKSYDFIIEPVNEGPYLMGYMLWVIDATEHYENLRHIRDAAIRDTLTGIYNRSYFQEIVEADIAAGNDGALVIFDLDNFKGVNDTYGHQCGDNVLNIFSGVLKKFGEIRLYSCRLGGDEFCIFIRNTTSQKEIEAVLKRIFDSFISDLEKDGLGGLTTLSAGVSVSKADKDFKLLYSEADRKLYEAKTSGKNHFLM